MEASWISRAATKLDDPIIMEWALHFFSDQPTRSESRKQLASLWFTAPMIARWLESDAIQTLGLMFQYLPAQQFSASAPAIAARWSEWPSSVANAAFGILASIAPELAGESAERFLESSPSSDQIFAIAENLEKLPPNVSLSLMEKLLPLVKKADAVRASGASANLFKTAVTLMPQALPELMDDALSGPDSQLSKAVKRMAGCLFGHGAYATLLILYADGYGVPAFSDLAALFENDAPLAEMDEIVHSETPLLSAM